jgi:glutamyl-Q tRNA(Asp) synthetase
VSAAKSSTATATTDTADGRQSYVGRFAPSPSGDLHWGSLYTAIASYLDARAHGGRWLVRIEDLDRPRVVPGSAAGILRTLRQFGLDWDDEVALQSDRTDRYSAALQRLTARGLTFECSCSRSQLADEERYPGYCRDRITRPGAATATRLRVGPGIIQFSDRIQGMFRQDVAAAVGDVVLSRRDGIFAYLLAVVVDDGAQNVTHIVRGADLLDNTPRQIHLQRLLGLPLPSYAHVPILTEADGSKLSKSARSVRIETSTASQHLSAMLHLLGLSLPRELMGAPPAEIWSWAIDRWRIERIPKSLTRSFGV